MFGKGNAGVNLFQAMVSRSKSNAIKTENLPVVNDFVDVATGGRTDTVCIEDISKVDFETRLPLKAGVGVPALFNYSNGYGRFRFHTQCIRIDGQRAAFALPTEITVIEQFDEKRKAFRLRKLVDVSWRYAPDAAGHGPFVRGKVLDLCANGTRLDVGRELRTGTCVEIRFDQIVVGREPIVVVGELVRPAKADDKGVISAGVKFKNLGATRENAISEFIQRYKKEDKERHLAR
jgi:hypothetical protein